MKILTFFNNKGGVGKTTLATNVASFLQLEFHKKVLMVDADPQSNSTQMIISEDKWEALYDKSKPGPTLLSFLEPILMGDSHLDLSKDPLSGNSNRFGVDIIPGHPRLSFMEEKLSSAWQHCTAADIGGFRVTNWVNSLASHFSSTYDYLVFDVGPSLGALNRSILLNSDFFLTPMGCDIYSLMGIENIAEWVSDWRDIYSDAALNVLNKRVPDFDFEKYHVTNANQLEKKTRYIGFSVQQYITKVIRGERRGINAYETIKRQIPEYVSKNLSFLIPNNRTVTDCNLGEMPHYFSLIPLAQTNNSPIHLLKSSDGIVGNQFNMVKDYKHVMDNLCGKILNNMGD